MRALLILAAGVVVWLWLQAQQGDNTRASAPQSDSTTTDNLDNILQGIFDFEGSGPSSRASRNNNPGNIEAGSWARSMGSVGSDGRFAKFSDIGDGWAALATYVQQHASQHPDWNFYDFFNYYLHGSTTAPPTDKEGNADQYADYVAGYAGVDPTTSVADAIGVS